MKGLTTKFSIICLILFMALVMSNCEKRITPAPPISTENYPTISIKNPPSNTVKEGGELKYVLNSNKPLEGPKPFKVYEVNKATGPFSKGYVPTGVVSMPGFTKKNKVTLKVTFPTDNIANKNPKKITYTIGIDPDNNHKIYKSINPESAVPETQTITVENYNSPSGLTVNFQWMNSNDSFKMLVAFKPTGGSSLHLAYIASGDSVATVLNSNGDPDGKWLYYIYAETLNEDVTSYKFRVGYPNQQVKIFNGKLNFEKATTANTPPFPVITYQGGDYILLLTAQKSGSTYTNVTHLNSGSPNTSSSLKIKNVHIITRTLHRSTN